MFGRQLKFEAYNALDKEICIIQEINSVTLTFYNLEQSE